MGIINRLDQHVSNMIAAGEVVERPAGIVKELIENSIDAQAKRIEIMIVQGGIESIRIIDDGNGMSEDDAVLAFERHATSKLRDENDLWHIQTMGFRGEALPSIAAVSHVFLQTCVNNEAVEVEVKYGEQATLKKISAPQGTMITVENLFRKTPARFKHLKNPAYELSLISDVVQKFALAYPEIVFVFSSEGKTNFKTSGNGNLQEVIMQIFGKEYAQNAISIDGSDNDFKVFGYAIQPKFSRASKYYMYIFINNRMIRNYRLQKAIIAGYREFLPNDRFPIVVLNITMDAQLVDVNVHPSKWEIRLSKEKQLENLIGSTINNALKEHFQIQDLVISKKSLSEKIEPMQFNYDYLNNEKTPVLQTNEKATTVSDYYNTIDKLSDENRPIKNNDVEINLVLEEPINLNSQQVSTKLPTLQVIGQLHGSYILAQGDEGLYIIDQHAAQEKFHFEKLKKQLENSSIQFQDLLLPINIEVNSGIIEQLDDLNLTFSQIGIEFEAFGENALLVRKVPTWLNEIDNNAFLNDMIDIWKSNENIDLVHLRKHAMATAACHSSIRFNRNLSLKEMEQVLIDLNSCEYPFHCPHGRPTFICVKDSELQKEFERV